MAIEVKYRQAVKFFLLHLQENNMTQRWLESFRQTLQGSFKRFIGSELKLYPLSMDKVRDRRLTVLRSSGSGSHRGPHDHGNFELST